MVQKMSTERLIDFFHFCIRKKHGKSKSRKNGRSISYLSHTPVFAVSQLTPGLLMRDLRGVWICTCALDNEK